MLGGCTYVFEHATGFSYGMRGVYIFSFSGCIAGGWIFIEMFFYFLFYFINAKVLKHENNFISKSKVGKHSKLRKMLILKKSIQ